MNVGVHGIGDGVAELSLPFHALESAPWVSCQTVCKLIFPPPVLEHGADF